MFSAVAVTNEQDILAIHGVVSDELKAQIEEAYPQLFGPEQFDFSDWEDDFVGSGLPFLVGKGLVDEKDRYKSLVVYGSYRVEMGETSGGVTVIRFFKRKL